MRRVWLGLSIGLLAVTVGCRAMPTAGRVSYRSACEPGLTNVIQMVPEPGPTAHETYGTQAPERFRLTRRGKGGEAAAAPEIPPRGEADPSTYVITKPNGVEHGFDKLPTHDPIKAIPAVAIKPSDGPFRAMTEVDVRTLAVSRSPAAYRMELENLIPASHVEPADRGRSPLPGSAAVDQFLRQARVLAAEAERVRAAGEAATTFYQLAESEGRAELLRAGVKALDDMRGDLGKPIKRVLNGRIVEVPAPDLSAFDSQRGQLLETSSQLMFLVKKLNIDLKQQTGLAGHTSDRLYPTGEFGIDPTPPDVPTLVREAIENRPDLQLLRLAYYELSEETLPIIRDQLKHTIGMMAPVHGIVPACRHRALLATAMERFGRKPCADPAMVQELAVRKAQLFDLICEKEREAADQVRTAALYRETAADLVASTRTRSEELRKKIDALRASKTATPAMEFPLLFEWYKARGDVIQAVMNWHMARVKLMAAGGKS